MPTELFASLTADEIAELRRCGSHREFRAEEILLREGEHNATLFAVESGALHAFRTSKKRRIFLAQLPAGSAFGEVSLFDPGAATATVAAVTDGTLLALDRGGLMLFLERQPAAGAKLMLQLLALMAQRIRATDSRLVDSLLWS